MKIYYRGYVINEDYPEERFIVQGRRPERATLSFADNPQSAMRWIDRAVLLQRVEDAGWLSPWALSA